jgi:hypothetical protein
VLLHQNGSGFCLRINGADSFVPAIPVSRQTWAARFAPSGLDRHARGCLLNLFDLPLGESLTLSIKIRFWVYIGSPTSFCFHSRTSSAAEAVTTADFLKPFLGCRLCSPVIREKLRLFSQNFAMEINRAVERVCINLSCRHCYVIHTLTACRFPYPRLCSPRTSERPLLAIRKLTEVSAR